MVSIGSMSLGCEDVELQLEDDSVSSASQDIRGPDTQWEERMTSGYSSAIAAIVDTPGESFDRARVLCSGVLVNPALRRKTGCPKCVFASGVMRHEFERRAAM
jgi:hypothetical protein